MQDHKQIAWEENQDDYTVAIWETFTNGLFWTQFDILSCIQNLDEIRRTFWQTNKLLHDTLILYDANKTNKQNAALETPLAIFPPRITCQILL